MILFIDDLGLLGGAITKAKWDELKVHRLLERQKQEIVDFLYCSKETNREIKCCFDSQEIIDHFRNTFDHKCDVLEFNRHPVKISWMSEIILVVKSKHFLTGTVVFKYYNVIT